MGIVSRTVAADVMLLTMPEYRAYTIGDEGHFIDAAPLICEDDDTAIKQAEQLVNGRAIELWSGKRVRYQAGTEITEVGAPLLN
jgi:hypothetical protein